MIAPELAACLEGKKEGREWRCRCPVHGGKSLSVAEKNGRILLTCRAGCSQEEVIAALRAMDLWGNVSCCDIPPPEQEPQTDIGRRADRASEWWEGSRPIEPGDPIYQYLSHRGIILDTWPDDLHTYPALPYWETDESGKPLKIGTFPALLAVVRDPRGRPVALHRTYVTSDGRKAPVASPKKIYKVHDLTGGAVRLFPPRDGVLAVCEGIEDALSAWILWESPTWACLGTSGLKSFKPPDGIRELLIFADRDKNGAGQKAAMELAQKLKKKMAVSVRLPGGQAKDINQLLQEGALHAV